MPPWAPRFDSFAPASYLFENTATLRVARVLLLRGAGWDHEEVDFPPVSAFVENHAVYDHFAPGEPDPGVGGQP